MRIKFCFTSMTPCRTVNLFKKHPWTPSPFWVFHFGIFSALFTHNIFRNYHIFLGIPLISLSQISCQCQNWSVGFFESLSVILFTPIYIRYDSRFAHLPSKVFIKSFLMIFENSTPLISIHSQVIFLNFRNFSPNPLLQHFITSLFFVLYLRTRSLYIFLYVCFQLPTCFPQTDIQIIQISFSSSF